MRIRPSFSPYLVTRAIVACVLALPACASNDPARVRDDVPAPAVDRGVTPAASAVAASSAPLSPSLFAEPAPSVTAAAEPDPAPATPRDRQKLGNFFDALAALEAKKRERHVRVAWFGDSHGQADFWTGALRSAMQRRFGDGGPGFLHIGYREARSERASLSAEGKWKMRPKAPASRIPSSDGIYGLGGMLLSAFAGPGRAVVTPSFTDSGPKQLVWDICYRLPKPGDSFALTLGSRRESVRATSDAPAGKLTHVTRHTSGTISPLVVTPTSGQPEFCGVYVETEAAPSFVLDNFGINGARYGTMLAWDETSFAGELARRAYDLVIFEFGTNEATDEHLPPERCAGDLARVAERVRAALPEADCLVVGPPDRHDRAAYMPRLRDALKKQAASSGCRFWDALAAMGGPGGMRTWRSENPPRGARDGIHLTARGYRTLGERLASELLGDYDRHVMRHP